MPRPLVLALVLLVSPVLGPLFAVEPAEVSTLRAKAEKGNALAQYNLGLAYAEGQGVRIDLPEAFVWLSLASENGSTGKALDSVLGSITDAQLAEGRRRLAEYRAALAARLAATPALVRGPARKPGTRIFSLNTPPTGAPKESVDGDAPTAKAPGSAASLEPLRPDEPRPDDPALVRNENIALKTELARLRAQIDEQAATIVRLMQELSARNAASPIQADAPRPLSPAGAVADHSRP